MRRLYSLLAERLGATDEPNYAPARPGDVRHSLARVERTRRALGVTTRVSIEEGLHRLVSWERSRHAD